MQSTLKKKKREKRLIHKGRERIQKYSKRYRERSRKQRTQWDMQKKLIKWDGRGAQKDEDKEREF